MIEGRAMSFAGGGGGSVIAPSASVWEAIEKMMDGTAPWVVFTPAMPRICPRQLVRLVRLDMWEAQAAG